MHAIPAMQCWKKRKQEVAATASRWPEWYFAVEFKTEASSEEDDLRFLSSTRGYPNDFF
jgi:hypothetical protein